MILASEAQVCVNFSSLVLPLLLFPVLVARAKRLSNKIRLTRRGNSLKVSNARLEVRRNVLSSLNALLEEVGADALQVDRMTKPIAQAFDRLLRVLENRCSPPPS